MIETTMGRLVLYILDDLYVEQIHLVEISRMHHFLPIAISALENKGFSLSEEDKRVSKMHFVALDRILQNLRANDMFCYVDTGVREQEFFFFCNSANLELQRACAREHMLDDECAALEDAAEAFFIIYYENLRLCRDRARQAS